eukprot:3773184-Alexandrium_andersonii.AAC.1
MTGCQSTHLDIELSVNAAAPIRNILSWSEAGIPNKGSKCLVKMPEPAAAETTKTLALPSTPHSFN